MLSLVAIVQGQGWGERNKQTSRAARLRGKHAVHIVKKAGIDGMATIGRMALPVAPGPIVIHEDVAISETASGPAM